ncbi:carbohydrate esterase family 4 protein [Hypoxylon sp. FL1284]|nr:carbohydrate esterase family 4 protein [Hypoxylon sp. FL1284]
MRWWDVLVLAACASQAAAHGGPNDAGHSVPKLAGSRRFMAGLKGKKGWEGRTSASQRADTVEARDDGVLEERGELEGRQREGRCGGSRGSCAAGQCCSYEGYCGTGEEYCVSPDCQINYGPGCDGNQKPSGADTSDIERPKIGDIQYGGVGIYDCENPGDIAITFDDGPYDYTEDLLDKLADWDVKATFFITGNSIGKGMINDPDYPWVSVIQRMAAEGHQIASHTWSHENYSQLTAEQFNNQMIWNEIALNDILGYFPTYMRPPYSICPVGCQRQLATLGYHVVYFDLDTEGYLHDDARQIQTSKDIWDDAVDGSDPCEDSYLEIEHDIHYQSVYNLTDYILDSLFSNGYRAVTVGQCLGDPPENWYRAGSGSVPEYNFTIREPTGARACQDPTPTSRPGGPSPTMQVSSDGKCGEGVTCQGSEFGNCCSVNQWCGASIDYCGENCLSDFGLCSPPDSSIPTGLPLPSGPGTPPDDPLPTGGLEVSIEGNCGAGFTCEGSEYGNCCSGHGFCGASVDYCGEGCQPDFGSGCEAAPAMITPTPSR